MKSRKQNLILAIMIALGASNAQATMLEQMDTAGLTKGANGIHVGEVVERHSEKDAATGMIYTLVKLRVDQTIKGTAADSVTVRVPGGQYEGYGMMVHGAASFRSGERALVFVRDDRDGSHSVVGMAQGKFKLVKSLVNGEEQALFQAPQNVEFFSRTPQGQVRHVVATQVDRKVPLNTLLREIREAVAKEGGVSH